MRTSLFACCFFLLSSVSFAQDTFKVVNWNMEYFGDFASQLPEEMDKSRTIMNHLDADVYALVEIVNTDSLQSLVSSLDSDYDFVVSPYGSFATSPSDPDYASAQKLAFVYRISKVRNVTARAFLDNSVGNAYYNWASGRYPFLVTAEVNYNNNQWQEIKFIIVHAKAMADNKSCLRRYEGGLEMKDSLDKNFPNDKFIVLGDFNDDFDVSICGGPSNYVYFVNDSTGNNYYLFPTLPLSRAGLASIYDYPGFIDHVILSNEMINDYIPGSAHLLKNEVLNWVTDYNQYVSDHFPVETFYTFTPPVTATSEVTLTPPKIFPNPAQDRLFIQCNRADEFQQYFLYSVDGKRVLQGAIDADLTPLNIKELTAGFYFIKLMGKGNCTLPLTITH